MRFWLATLIFSKQLRSTSKLLFLEKMIYFIAFASELSNARISGFANTFARSSGSTSSATVEDQRFFFWNLRNDFFNIFHFWNFFLFHNCCCHLFFTAWSTPCFLLFQAIEPVIETLLWDAILSSIQLDPPEFLFSLKYERKIIPSYNETLRACFTVVKSKFFYFFSYEFSCEFFFNTTRNKLVTLDFCIFPEIK